LAGFFVEDDAIEGRWHFHATAKNVAKRGETWRNVEK
jgi:hypothetical protein